MQIGLRPARVDDFEYCASLYFAGLDRIIRELKLDPAAEAIGLRQQWDPAQVQIITLDGADVGWLQGKEIHRESYGDELFMLQFFLDGAFQRRGIGTEVMNRIIDEATRARQAVTLGVAKINHPSLQFVQRLGFRITHEDDHRFYLKRDLDTEIKSDNI